MPLYAAIFRGVVADLSPTRIQLPDDTIWLDVTGVSPAPQVGWLAVATGEIWTLKSQIPDSVTNFQTRAVLMSMASPTGTAGRTLFDDVDAVLKSQGGVAFQAWEYNNEVTRAGDLVNALAAQLGLTGAQLDALFVAAARISA